MWEDTTSPQYWGHGLSKDTLTYDKDADSPMYDRQSKDSPMYDRQSKDSPAYDAATKIKY